ncbi:hypothetical protein FQR65_LT15602 [Abscondita terminalis]|nr:hypothetical protein FQR65_LT15602 [Abscondita terminalis]
MLPLPQSIGRRCKWGGTDHIEKEEKCKKTIANSLLRSSVMTPQRMMKLMDSYTYLSLFNEAQWNDQGNPTKELFRPQFTKDQLEKYRTGEDPDLYPSVNWLDLLRANTQSSRYYYTVNFRGGSDKVSCEGKYGEATGSDNFAAGNRWGGFPAAGVAWYLSNEKFMEGFAEREPALLAGIRISGKEVLVPYSSGRPDLSHRFLQEDRESNSSGKTNPRTGYLLRKFKNRQYYCSRRISLEHGHAPSIPSSAKLDFYLYYAEVCNEIDPNDPNVINYWICPGAGQGYRDTAAGCGRQETIIGRSGYATE